MFVSLFVSIALLAGPSVADSSSGAGAEWLSQAVIQRAYERLNPAIVRLNYSTEITNPNTGELTKRESDTIGLIVSADGLVLAHGHMTVENRKPENITVHVGLGDAEKEYDGLMLRKPEDVNVAFLRIDAPLGTTFPYIKFEDSALELGEPIISIGILGDTLDYARAIQTRRIGAVLNDPRAYYLLDEPVAFGYVGGPVVDALGRTIGVIGFDLATNEGGDIYTRSGYPLVFRPNLFAGYIKEPLPSDGEEGDADDAWLGVFTQPLTDDLATYWKLPKDGGIVVSTIIPGSPAETSGIRSGDVVVSFNGKAVTAKQDHDVAGFTKMVRDCPVGQPLPIRLVRDGQPVDLQLTLTTRPKSSIDAAEFDDDVLGLTVRELTTDARIALSIPREVNGVLIQRVKSGSAANQARLGRNILVMAIDDAPVGSVDAYKDTIEKLKQAKPAEVVLFCRVGANTGFFRLRPRWNP
ncbi:MAG: PDZ domain-containing protein [Candidatus Hydrogenedentota bacterium]